MSSYNYEAAKQSGVEAKTAAGKGKRGKGGLPKRDREDLQGCFARTPGHKE